MRWLDGIIDSKDTSLSKLLSTQTAISRRYQRTRKPGVPQSMQLQRVRHDLATEQKQQHHVLGHHPSGAVSKLRYHQEWQLKNDNFEITRFVYLNS